MSKNNTFEIDFSKKKQTIVFHILRILLFELILFIGAYLKGLLTDPSLYLIIWGMLILNFIYSFSIIRNRYQNIFLSIYFGDEIHKIKYLKNGQRNSLDFHSIVATSKVSFTNFSTKTTLPVTIVLNLDNKIFKFRILLKQMILLFFFIEKNGGTIKKDFDFSCSLKELLSNEEYEDVKNEITELLH